MDPAPPGAMPSMASTLRAPVSGVCPPPSTGVRATGSASAVAYPDRASLDCPGRTFATAKLRSGNVQPRVYPMHTLIRNSSLAEESSSLKCDAAR